MKSKSTTSEEPGFLRFLKPLAIGAAAGLVVSLLALALFALILSYQSVPHVLVTPLSIAAVCIGGLVAGVVAGRLLRSKGLLIGLATGLFLYLVTLLASFSLSADAFGMMALIKLGATVLCGVVGGVFGVNTAKKRR